MFVVCKQRTGYEMRIRDWSSDVCSSDLQIVVLEDLVAVVADHTWVAIKGASLLDIVWDEGPNAALGSAEIWGALRRDSTKPGANAKTEGDPDKALTEIGRAHV